MNEEIDIESWTDSFAGNAVDVFGPRLKLVGIQGSRARGEARPDSDIDVVLVVEGLDDDDLAAYRTLLATMPYGDLACGFTGSPELLISWPRHDVFNLVQDTRVVLGSFAFMDTDFTADDAMLSAKVGASARLRRRLARRHRCRLRKIGLLRHACIALCQDRRVSAEPRCHERARNGARGGVP